MNNHLILDSLSVGIFLIDKNFKVKYMNKMMRELLKKTKTAEEYTDKTCGNVLECIYTRGNIEECGTTEECKNCSLRNKLTEVFENEKTFQIDQTLFTLEKENNKKLTFKIKGQKIKNEEKEYLLLEFEDAEFEKKLKMESDRLKQVLDSMDDFVFFQNEELQYRYLNKKSSEILSEKTANYFEKSSKIALKEGSYFKEEFYEGKFFRIMKRKIKLPDKSSGVFSIIRDISKEREKEKIYKEKIYKDFLTGLHNRNYFEEELKKLLLKKEKQDFTMAIIDLDNLKKINDTYGHHIGDGFIKEIGKIIKKNISSKDKGIRFGGDEFIVLSPEKKKFFLKKIIDILDACEELSTEDLKISVSAGVVEKNSSNETLDSLYKRADLALYESKKLGKNRITIK